MEELATQPWCPADVWMSGTRGEMLYSATTGDCLRLGVAFGWACIEPDCYVLGDPMGIQTNALVFRDGIVLSNGQTMLVLMGILSQWDWQATLRQARDGATGTVRSAVAS